MEAIKKGSVESIIVALKDRLENLSDVSTIGDLRFYVTLREDGTTVQPDSLPAFDPDEPMWAVCSIDTTLGGYVANKVYNLYIKYTAGTESPILGPQPFRVVSD